MTFLMATGKYWL